MPYGLCIDQAIADCNLARLYLLECTGIGVARVMLKIERIQIFPHAAGDQKAAAAIGRLLDSINDIDMIHISAAHFHDDGSAKCNDRTISITAQMSKERQDSERHPIRRYLGPSRSPNDLPGFMRRSLKKWRRPHLNLGARLAL